MAERKMSREVTDEIHALARERRAEVADLELRISVEEKRRGL